MIKSTLRVDGMSCEHCVKAITKAISDLPGIKNVSIDLKAKTVTVEHDPDLSSLDKIKQEIENQGYYIIQ